jgi:hypothetical protein
MKITRPHSAMLEKPHLVERDMANAKRSFYELAQSRITYRNGDEYYKTQY